MGYGIGCISAPVESQHLHMHHLESQANEIFECVLLTSPVQVLLDFQMSGHQRFLAGFVKAFRAVDTEGKGVLDEEGFRLLLSDIAPHKDEPEVRRLLSVVDPHNRQQLTFSDCVATLSTDLVTMLHG